MIIPPSAFSQLLSTHKGRRVFFERLKGNNGDTLIQMGMRELIEQHELNEVSQPAAADLILINGGGAMNDIWPEGGAQVIESYLRSHPGKEILVGPSSYHFTKLDFAEILRQSSAPITLFSREQRSVDFLRGLSLPTTVKLGLSSDLAFELVGTKFIGEQQRLSTDSIILCAMRKDQEGNAGILAKTRAPWLPRFIRLPLSRLRDRLVADRSSDTLKPILDSIQPPINEAEVVYRDVSVSVPFEEFCAQVRQSRVIITNRLHVGIFGSLLGKRVHLIRGAYHKIEGVYKYSLEGRPGISLH